MLNRVDTAYAAGCDMLLVCNAPDVVGEVLSNWRPTIDTQRGKRVEALLPDMPAMSWQALQADSGYQAAKSTIAELMT
jgi:beta-N-acetylhexosaminidase